MDANDKRLVKEYKLQLKDLYKTIGNVQFYQDTLWELVTDDCFGNLALYNELKSLYTEEEWKRKVEVLFSQCYKKSGIDALYAEEKAYDRLLQLIMNSSGLDLLQKHQVDLVEYDSEAVLYKYASELDKMMIHANGRKYYQDIVVHLKNMVKIHNGENVVCRLVNDWKQLYSNRPAMIQELNRIGSIGEI